MNDKNIFRFIDIGEGLTEGVIQEIKVKVGDNVEEGQSLLFIQTDKVASDLPSPKKGVVLLVYINEGVTVRVGDPLIYIGDPGETLTDEITPKSTAKLEVKKNQIVKPVKEEQKEKLSEGSSVVGQVTVSNKLMGKLGTQNDDSFEKDKLYSLTATPLARKYANQLHINLSQVNGSGVDGRIVYDDILLFQRNRLSNELNDFNKNQKQQDVALTVGQNDYTHPISPIRKQIANTMSKARNNVANTVLFFEVNITELNVFRNKIKDDFKKKNGVNITYLAFFVQATSLALRKYPIFNAVYDPNHEEMIYRNDINMGIAVDTKEGLIVPNIKNSDELSLTSIALEITRLAKLAREKKLTLSEIQDGTYTITNLGSTGAMYGQPIIFFPQVSILGLGGIEKKVYLDKNKKPQIKDVIYISVSADHRWIDGADIGRFANFIKEQIEFKFYERDFKNAK
mgnify:CR=1 FL=1